MLTFFRILYAAVVFLWEQWRKDEEDVKKGRRPYNFIIALLLVLVAVVVGYNWMIFRTSTSHIGQCLVKGSNDEALWVRGQPVVFDYTMVHRINNLTMSTEFLLAKADTLCKAQPDQCGEDVQVVISRTREETEALDKHLVKIFSEEVVSGVATNTQHAASPQPANSK